MSIEKLAVPLWPDAGKALGLGKSRTYESARVGEIPTVRFGKSIRVPVAALQKMLESAGQKADGEAA
jgi:excisionase family DNA binding protein